MQFTNDTENTMTNNNKHRLVANNLIISNEPIEPLNEYYSPDISENNFKFDLFRQRSVSVSSQDDFDNENPPQQIRVQIREKTHSRILTNPDPLYPQDENADGFGQIVTTGRTTDRPILVSPMRIREDRLQKKSKEQEQMSIIRTESEIVIGPNLMKLFYIRRFINRLLHKRKDFSMLTSYHMQLLNDKAAFYSQKLFQHAKLSQVSLGFLRLSKPKELSGVEKYYNKIRRTMIVLIVKLDQWEQQLPLIYPQSRIKVMWDVFITFMRIYFLIIIPIQVAFPDQFLFSQNLIIITIFATIMLVLDLALSFNTAYYKFGSIVKGRKCIAYNTLMKCFGLEIFSIMTLIVMFFIANNTFFEGVMIVFLVQIANIQKMLRQFEEVLNLSKKQSSMLKLGKLALTVLYILHIFSCLWYWCGKYSLDSGSSWLSLRHLEHDYWGTQYLQSFYYSTVTMFTVGYGDITPQSDLEIIISIVFMMISSIQLSYSVNTVGSIINQISMYSEQKLKKLRILNTYMSKKKISYHLQFQIREYLNYYWESQQVEETSEEKEIIDQLSEQLREKLMVEANSIILDGSPLFEQVFSNPLKMKLIKSIKSVVVQPENIIEFSKQTPKGQSGLFICFIEIGSVEIFHQSDQSFTSKESVVKELGQGQNFGLQSFLSGIKTTELFKSVGFTKLLIISRDDFLKIVQDFPEDREKFCMLRDDILFRGGQYAAKTLNISCFSCQSNSHSVFGCPILHFVVDREKTIKHYQFSRYQKRNEVRVNRYKSKDLFCALNDQTIIAEVAGFIQKDYHKFIQAYDNEDQEQDSDVSSESSQTESLPRKRGGSQQLELKGGMKKRGSIKLAPIPLESIEEDFDYNQLNSQKTIQVRKSVSQGLSKNQKPRRRQSILSVKNNSDSQELSPFKNPTSFAKIESSNHEESPQLTIQLERFASIPSSTSILSIHEDQHYHFEGEDSERQIPQIQKKEILKSALKTQSQQLGRSDNVSFCDALKQIHQNKQDGSQSKYIKRSHRFAVGVSGINAIQLTTQEKLKISLEQVQLRQKRRAFFKNKEDLDQLDILSILLTKQTTYRPDMFRFERSENFKHYFTQNNIIVVIHQPTQQVDKGSFSRLIQYMLYPQVYTSQYKNQVRQINKQEGQKSTNEVSNNPKGNGFASQIQTFKEILKVRNKARKMIQSRKQNVQRVTPTND